MVGCVIVFLGMIPILSEVETIYKIIGLLVAFFGGAIVFLTLDLE